MQYGFVVYPRQIPSTGMYAVVAILPGTTLIKDLGKLQEKYRGSLEVRNLSDNTVGVIHLGLACSVRALENRARVLRGRIIRLCKIQANVTGLRTPQEVDGFIESRPTRAVE